METKLRFENRTHWQWSALCSSLILCSSFTSDVGVAGGGFALPVPSCWSAGSMELGFDLVHCNQTHVSLHTNKNYSLKIKNVFMIIRSWDPNIIRAACCPESSPSLETLTLRLVSVLLITAEESQQRNSFIVGTSGFHSQSFTSSCVGAESGKKCVCICNVM